MKAMILAAGLGTRLSPFTETKPKALYEIEGKTLLELVLKRLDYYGIKDIVINLHHFPDQIKNYLKTKKNFGLNIEFSLESDQLLDTGGGVRNASWFFTNTSEPFLVHNVDVLSDIDLIDLFEYHNTYKPLATIAVKDRETSRSLLVNKAGYLCGWKHNTTQETIISLGKEKDLFPTAFSGIQILSPEIFKQMPQEGPFSLTKFYLKLAQKQLVFTYNHDYSYWFDMGDVGKIEKAIEIIRQNFM